MTAIAIRSIKGGAVPQPNEVMVVALEQRDKYGWYGGGITVPTGPVGTFAIFAN